MTDSTSSSSTLTSSTIAKASAASALVPDSLSIPLDRPLSKDGRKFTPLSLIRSTDTHPPHHAHFDIPEGNESDDHHNGNHNQQGGTYAGTITPGTPGSSRTTPGGGTRKASKSGKKRKPVIDIEHVPVDDDPREWSNTKKNFVLGMMTLSVLGPLIAPSIYNPVIDEVKSELHATETDIGLSLSMYILLQGWGPVLWASIAEIIGRKVLLAQCFNFPKPVYLVSYALYFIGALVGSQAHSMTVFILMRCLQACGSSAVVAIGAGSLADMFEVHERGQKLGIFYGMPLLGPSIGPLIGGALGHAFGWRAAFYFLTAYAGICEIMFIFVPDTWRRERSRVYQKAIEGAVKRAMQHDIQKEHKRQRKFSRGLSSSAATTPGNMTPGSPIRDGSSEEMNLGDVAVGIDVEKNEAVVVPKRSWRNFGRRRVDGGKEEAEHAPIRPSFRDINPLPTMASIFKQPANFLILLCSGVLFAGQYVITYTAAITLSKAPYNYNALNIGLVILSFGVGSIIGSLGGGKYSDIVLKKMKKRNGGISNPEMRLKSTIPAMPIMIGGFLTYAWTAQEKVNVAGIVVSLFFSGLGLMVIYASTLAYLVDSNPGRSASAVSCNSFVRGSFGCILSQTALPIQNAIGDGGLYTIFSGLLALSSAGIMFLSYRGEAWRHPDHTWPWQRKEIMDDADSQCDEEADSPSGASHDVKEQSQSEASAPEDNNIKEVRIPEKSRLESR